MILDIARNETGLSHSLRAEYDDFGFERMLRHDVGACVIFGFGGSVRFLVAKNREDAIWVLVDNKK